MSFQITALELSQFSDLFHLSAEELAARRARRMIVDQKPGFPCRVSLADAEVGEEVLLVHYEHQTADTPFRSSHAVFVRPRVSQANLQSDEVPEVLRTRMLSLRGFDPAGMLIAAELSDGMSLEPALESMFDLPAVSYIHLHFAKPGCYAARVDRA